MVKDEQKTKDNETADNLEPTNNETAEVATDAVDKASIPHHHRFLTWYKSQKKWSILATILLLLLVLFCVPFTRYKIAGLVIKKDYVVQVNDSTANIPVSGAEVVVGSSNAITDNTGKAHLKSLKAGPQTFVITKKYYQAKSTQFTVGILSQKQTPVTSLVATGRQVKIKTTNLITGKTLSNVTINVAGTSAKTNNSGEALIVLPAKSPEQKASLSLIGYNDASVVVKVSNNTIKENDFALTPAGKIYFLSNSTGSLNVMKANLDGSSPQIAVAATGTEQASSSRLLQSGDGKYLALVTKRSASDATPQLYILSIGDDKLLQTDSGNAAFQLYSWVGDTLVYTVQRNDLAFWQQGTSKIKAYDASTGSTVLLDQTSGSDPTTAINEYYTEIMVTDRDVIFAKGWQSQTQLASSTSDKKNTLQVIGVDGRNHQNLASFDASSVVYYAPHGPNTLYIWQHPSSGADTFSQYSDGGSVKPLTNVSSDQFYDGQHNYFYSPSGDQTFWSEDRNGKQTILVGDKNGANTSAVLSGQDFTSYNWFTDQYLLLNKNNNEIYITNLKGGAPIKVTDYLSGSYSYY